MIRWIVIGWLVYHANVVNTNEISHYKGSCCACYYASEDNSLDAESSGYRYDLSYCIPECTDCGYCEKYFEHNGTSIMYSNNDTQHCQNI